MKKPTLPAARRSYGLLPSRTAASTGKLPAVFHFADRTKPVKISCVDQSPARQPWPVRQIQSLARFWKSHNAKRFDWSSVRLSAPLYVRACRKVVLVRGFAQSGRSHPVIIHFENKP